MTEHDYPHPRLGDAQVSLHTDAFLIGGIIANLPSRIPRGERPSDNPGAAWLWDQAVAAIGDFSDERAPRPVRRRHAAESLGKIVLEARTEPDPDSSAARTITLDLTTGEWLSSPRGGITGEEGQRVAAAVLPGMPVEEVARAYGAYMSDDPAPADSCEGRLETDEAPHGE